MALRSKPSIDPMVRCIAARRHLLDAGETREEIINGLKVWVARLECVRCGCLRLTTYEPSAYWNQIGGHRYVHQSEYKELLRDLDAAEATRQILSAMWVKNAPT